MHTQQLGPIIEELARISDDIAPLTLSYAWRHEGLAIHGADTTPALHARLYILSRAMEIVLAPLGSVAAMGVAYDPQHRAFSLSVDDDRLGRLIHGQSYRTVLEASARAKRESDAPATDALAIRLATLAADAREQAEAARSGLYARWDRALQAHGAHIEKDVEPEQVWIVPGAAAGNNKKQRNAFVFLDIDGVLIPARESAGV